MYRKIKENIKYIKIKDILSVFIFIIMVIPSLIYKLYLKLKHRKLYLICEDPKEARDNGYHLFKYIRTNYKDDYVYYVIDKKSKDYNKIKDYGNIIQFYSLKHWIYYLSATRNISTHKYGNPSPPLFYFLHVVLGLYNNRIFLQHGITQNDSKWLYYKNTKFKTIICAAKPEYDYIVDKFGYPKKNVQYLGFPRFDNLSKKEFNNKQIVIMPTWRNWLGRDTNIIGEKNDFFDTDFYKKYYELINDDKFINYIENKGITVYFFPHRNMQKYLYNFKSKSKNVKIVGNDDIDIQDLIINSALMVTDYSSVAFDFAYMNKPLLYYQFDIDEFRHKQLQEGYFSYDDDGFGEVHIKKDDLVKSIIDIIDNNYEMKSKYKERISKFFELNDTNNCKRVYNYIRGE